MTDYKQSLIDEYTQLYDKREKLNKILNDYKYGKLSFTPKSSYQLLSSQYAVMGAYCHILLERARNEGITIAENKHESSLL